VSWLRSLLAPRARPLSEVAPALEELRSLPAVAACRRRVEEAGFRYLGAQEIRAARTTFVREVWVRRAPNLMTTHTHYFLETTCADGFLVFGSSSSAPISKSLELKEVLPATGRGLLADLEQHEARVASLGPGRRPVEAKALRDIASFDEAYYREHAPPGYLFAAFGERLAVPVSLAIFLAVFLPALLLMEAKVVSSTSTLALVTPAFAFMACLHLGPIVLRPR